MSSRGRRTPQSSSSNKENSKTRKRTLSIEQVETIFIDKFQEKYKLTKKDIKKAFTAFDFDGSGYLSHDELAKVVGHFVNGVERELIDELVSIYDVDGNGNISLEEFTNFLLSRTAKDPNDWLTVTDLKARRDAQFSKNSGNFESHRSDSMYAPSEIHTTLDGENIEAVEYATKIFLGGLHAQLQKRARQVWKDRKVSSTMLKNRTGVVIEDIAKKLFLRPFKSYIEPGSQNVLSLPVFNDIICSMKPTGLPDPERPVVEMMYAAMIPGDGGDSGAIHNRDLEPELLCDIIFDKGTQTINRFGFGQLTKPHTETGRPEVGRGPIPPTFTDNGEVTTLPYRFLTHQCRTSMPAPSDLSKYMIDRSNSLPSWRPIRDHCFGLNAFPYAGQSIQGIPGSNGQRIIYNSAALSVIHDVGTNTQQFFDLQKDDVSCVTISRDGKMAATGAVGRRPYVLVWSTDLGESMPDAAIQRDPSWPAELLQECGRGFFVRAINAVSISYDSKLVCAIGCDDHHTLGVFSILTGERVAEATAANGAPPQISTLLWSPGSQSTEFITREHDGECDVLVSAGFRHLKFWSLRRPTHTHVYHSIIGRSGRLSPQVGSGSAKAKAGKKVGKAKGMTASEGAAAAGTGLPKIHHTAAFLENPNQSSGLPTYDVITGGDNGNLYYFRRGVCSRIINLIPQPTGSLPQHGGIRAVHIVDDKVFAAGGKGTVVAAYLNDFSEINRWSVMPQANGLKPQTSMGSVPAQFAAGMPSSRQPTPHRPLSGRRYGTTEFSYRPKSQGVNGTGLGGLSAGGDFAISSKKKVKAPPDQWGGEQDPQLKRAVLPEGVFGSFDVTGIVLCKGRSSGTGGNRARGNIYGGVDRIIVATAFGKAFTIDITRPVTDPRHVETLFYYHYGPVWALCSITSNSIGDALLSGGDDRWVCMWGLEDNNLLSRCRMQAPVRTIDFAKGNGNFFAAGSAGGVFGIYFIDRIAARSEGLIVDPLAKPSYNLIQMASRKDCSRDVSDMKFSPQADLLAVGSHDADIDLYTVHLTNKDTFKQIDPSCNIVPLRRLRGHRSYITHVDWSCDGSLLRSTCGAYEILMWDVESGKHILSSGRSTESDVKWETFTAPLGFGVMGVWPEGADGTDINAVDVSYHRNLVVTADDFGNAKLLNYPCIVDKAPGHIMNGHSSHVMSARFAGSNDDFVATVGGNDNTLMSWIITRQPFK